MDLEASIDKCKDSGTFTSLSQEQIQLQATGTVDEGPSALKKTIKSNNSVLMTPYAKVNSSSRNRRELIREETRDKTPEASNRKVYQHQYHTQMTFKMPLQPSDDPIASIKGIVKEFLREMSQCDSYIAILTWRNKSTLEQLNTSSTTMPTTVTTTYKYMHKMFGVAYHLLTVSIG